MDTCQLATISTSWPLTHLSIWLTIKTTALSGMLHARRCEVITQLYIISITKSEMQNMADGQQTTITGHRSTTKVLPFC